MENENIMKEFGSSTVNQMQEQIQQQEVGIQSNTHIQKLVATMLFISHSKLAIKLRYILALYREER